MVIRRGLSSSSAVALLVAHVTLSVALPSVTSSTRSHLLPPHSASPNLAWAAASLPTVGHRARAHTSVGPPSGIQSIVALRGGAPKLPVLPFLKRVLNRRGGGLTKPEANSAGGDAEMAPKKNLVSLGRIELLFVALLYGSLTVAFRFLYSLDGPPTAAALSFGRGILAAACFIPTILSTKTAPPSGGSSAPIAASKMTFWIAAAELAAWNLGSQGLLNVGLLFTEASRGSFLTQLSVVLTPIVSLFAGQKVGLDVAVGCAMALAGVVILSASESAVGVAAGAATGLFGINVGDIFCIMGALCWSLYIFRLSSWVNKGLEPTPLQAWKTVILAGMYFLWMLVDVVKSGWAWGALWPGLGSAMGLLVLVYSAIGPGAVADVMQSQAQQKVTAAEANVILSSEPLWALLFGVVLLGEVITFNGALGGMIIVAAALVASGVFTPKPKSLGEKSPDTK